MTELFAWLMALAFGGGEPSLAEFRDAYRTVLYCQKMHSISIEKLDSTQFNRRDLMYSRNFGNAEPVLSEQLKGRTDWSTNERAALSEEMNNYRVSLGRKYGRSYENVPWGAVLPEAAAAVAECAGKWESVARMLPRYAASAATIKECQALLLRRLHSNPAVLPFTVYSIAPAGVRLDRYPYLKRPELLTIVFRTANGKLEPIDCQVV